MTHIWNDAKSFPADSLAGFVDLNSETLQAVHGGVVRLEQSPSTEVALVVGGGSGHYPAFAGWVGEGMAHGSVCGNIFASPSASQASSVMEASDNGAGVIMMFGNYAGDVLHFGRAADELNSSGHDVRIVAITDDVASGYANQQHSRRGIAGDFPIAKITGAACAEGLPIEEVERVARKANSRTRSLGVAFSGCTLPGSSSPLFTVEEGQVAIGLGIHGEPGISTTAMMPAGELAQVLCDTLLEETPAKVSSDKASRVAVLVNGLGATKYEELFLLYGEIARHLRAQGLELVAPVVDGQVTSLDMSGCSLTLTFLDDELERLWLRPCDTPAFRRGDVRSGGHHDRRVVKEKTKEALQAGSPDSARQAERAVKIFEAFNDVAQRKEAELAALDSVAGDGDHGEAIVLGTRAALAAARECVNAHTGLATLLQQAGAAWEEGSGGTSGALWGSALQACAAAVSDDRAASAEELLRAAREAVTAIEHAGGSQPGDKTMVDAAHPFAEVLADAEGGTPLGTAWASAVAEAHRGAEASAAMMPRRGRARNHGQKAVGHPDPGAVSFALLMESAIQPLTDSSYVVKGDSQ